jgi:hypothetical protein
MRNWTTKLGIPGDTADPIEKSVFEKIFKKVFACTSYSCDLPTSPVFSPHFWFIVLVWLKVFTVETVARINLSHDQQITGSSEGDVWNLSKLKIIA